MQITREEISGIVGAAVFAVLLLLVLLFSYFTIMMPPDELEGIPVMFGSVENAFGTTEPPYQEISPEVVNRPEIPEYAPESPLITQNTDPTIEVEAKREEEQRRRQLEEQRRIEEEARDTAGDRGDTEGGGTQGVSTGSDTKGGTSGLGGIGTYDLGGRSLGSGGLAQPSYSVDDYGKVVVSITVDPRGNVVNAEIGRGTNTPNSALRQEALKAARRTKFNSINSVNNQQGTITYRFKLN